MIWKFELGAYFYILVVKNQLMKQKRFGLWALIFCHEIPFFSNSDFQLGCFSFLLQ